MSQKKQKRSTALSDLGEGWSVTHKEIILLWPKSSYPVGNWAEWSKQQLKVISESKPAHNFSSRRETSYSSDPSSSLVDALMEIYRKSAELRKGKGAAEKLEREILANLSGEGGGLLKEVPLKPRKTGLSARIHSRITLKLLSNTTCKEIILWHK